MEDGLATDRIRFIIAVDRGGRRDGQTLRAARLLALKRSAGPDSGYTVACPPYANMDKTRIPRADDLASEHSFIGYAFAVLR